jgi:Putative transposase
LFRGKFLAALRTALEEGTLCLPPDLSIERCRSILNKLGREKWNVHLQQRYDHGQGVLTYLARYVRGGPLKNTQLSQASDRHIAFQYRSHRETEKGVQLLRLETNAFLLRYLQHTPLPSKPIVRHYGIYATRHETTLNQARAQHAQSPVQEPNPLTWQSHYQHRAGAITPITHCPLCGHLFMRLSIVSKEPLANQQAPPP